MASLGTEQLLECGYGRVLVELNCVPNANPQAGFPGEKGEVEKCRLGQEWGKWREKICLYAASRTVTVLQRLSLSID